MEVYLIFLMLGLVLYQYNKIKSMLEVQRKDLFDMEGRLIQRIKEQRLPKEVPVQNVVNTIVEVEIKKEVETPLIPAVEPKLAPTSLEIISENHEVLEEEKESVFGEPIKFVELPEDATLNDEVEKEEPIFEREESPKSFETEPLSWFESFSKRNPDLERFIGENLISKIGIAILVLGIGYFVKYAIDQNWINEIARVGIGFLAGAALLTLAHKLRKTFTAFSSVLVAGGVAVFYFTLSIAFQDYHIFSQSITFILLCVVTGFSVFVSLAYDRQELAILSLIGGFVAPLLVSTGEGNYIVLFTYLLILDASLLVLAFYRNWSILNGVTYFLTVLMFGAWFKQNVLVEDATQEIPFLGALLFATAFYVIFTLSNLINQIKEKQAFRPYELSLILSNTFLYFTCGLSILSLYNPSFKGVFTVGLAAFNFVITYFVRRQNGVDKNLFYLLIGVTLTFVTLAAPLQLSGNYITLFWAAEASLLLWLAQKSGLSIYRFISIPVMLLGLVSMLMDWTQVYGKMEALTPLYNPAFISSLSLVLSMFLYIRLLRQDSETSHQFMELNLSTDLHLKATLLLLLPLMYFAGFTELDYHLNQVFEMSIQIGAYEFLYHLLFTSTLLFLCKRSYPLYFDNLIMVFGGINLLGYSFYFGLSYIREINYLIESNSGLPHTYIVHYFCIIPFVYQMMLLYKFIKQKWYNGTAWLLTLMLCFLLSAELQWQVLSFNLSDIQAQVANAIDVIPVDGYERIAELSTNINKSGYPILWGLLAFVLLSFGIRRAYKALRIAALALIGLTILKLFVYDIRNVSEGGKIAAFILLGVLLLVISFTYQKIKAIIIDGEEQQNEG